ncbi:MAG TPA: hypothetical protein VGN72_21530 [Tepidisphaeraceae bacterium]|jgi:hypothetical protein|nr:hypothetical protein [Tepidisphaeraceae bacterium]
MRLEAAKLLEDIRVAASDASAYRRHGQVAHATVEAVTALFPNTL